jgi:hypothetical protein
VTRGSELSLAAPRYEAHVTDENVPLGVKMEQRGKYVYVLNNDEDDPPEYAGRED